MNELRLVWGKDAAAKSSLQRKRALRGNNRLNHRRAGMDRLIRKNKDSRAIHTLTDPYPGDPAKPSYRLWDSESSS